MTTTHYCALGVSEYSGCPIFNTLLYIHVRMSVRNFVYSKDLEGSCGQYSVANCRCDVSAFDLRKSMWRLSKIDVATFEDRCIAFRI